MKRIIEALFKHLEKSRDVDNCKEYTFSENIQLNKIKTLEVLLKNANVQLIYSDEENIALSLLYKKIGDNKDVTFDIKKLYTALKLEELVDSDLFEFQITIRIPKQISNIEIKTLNGNIVLQGNQYDCLKVESSNGNVEMADTVFFNGIIKTKTGNVGLKKITYDSLDVLSENGNILLTESMLGNSRMKNQNGNIIFKRCRSSIMDVHMVLESVNGRVRRNKMLWNNEDSKSNVLSTMNQHNEICLYSVNGNITID